MQTRGSRLSGHLSLPTWLTGKSPGYHFSIVQLETDRRLKGNHLWGSDYDLVHIVERIRSSGHY